MLKTEWEPVVILKFPFAPGIQQPDQTHRVGQLVAGHVRELRPAADVDQQRPGQPDRLGPIPIPVQIPLIQHRLHHQGIDERHLGAVLQRAAGIRGFLQDPPNRLPDRFQILLVQLTGHIHRPVPLRILLEDPEDPGRVLLHPANLLRLEDQIKDSGHNGGQGQQLSCLQEEPPRLQIPDLLFRQGRGIRGRLSQEQLHLPVPGGCQHRTASLQIPPLGIGQPEIGQRRGVVGGRVMMDQLQGIGLKDQAHLIRRCRPLQLLGGLQQPVQVRLVNPLREPAGRVANLHLFDLAAGVPLHHPDRERSLIQAVADPEGLLVRPPLEGPLKLTPADDRRHPAEIQRVGDSQNPLFP